MDNQVIKPWGCHSKPRSPGHWVQDGYNDARTMRFTVWILDAMSKDCKYRHETPNDPRCEGCTCP